MVSEKNRDDFLSCFFPSSIEVFLFLPKRGVWMDKKFGKQFSYVNALYRLKMSHALLARVKISTTSHFLKRKKVFKNILGKIKKKYGFKKKKDLDVGYFVKKFVFPFYIYSRR